MRALDSDGAHRGAARAAEVDALVLSGGLGYFLEALADDAEQDDGLDPTSLLSTHPDCVHALMSDPLVHDGGFPAEMVESLERTWPQVRAALAAGLPRQPVLLVHGERDPIVPVAVSQDVAAFLPRSTLRVCPGDLHDVLNEHDRDEVHDLVAAFVNGVAEPAGSATGSAPRARRPPGRRRRGSPSPRSRARGAPR